MCVLSRRVFQAVSAEVSWPQRLLSWRSLCWGTPPFRIPGGSLVFHIYLRLLVRGHLRAERAGGGELP